MFQVQNIAIIFSLGIEKVIQELEKTSQELEVIVTARKDFNKNQKWKSNEDEKLHKEGLITREKGARDLKTKLESMKKKLKCSYC